jgi:hypothetical protein
MKKEIIQLEYDEIREFWNELYYPKSSTELKGEIFEHVEKINTSQYSDGESWDYIVKRKSDGKLFKFNVWDAGEHNGYIFSDGDPNNTLTEVIQKKVQTNKYE